MRTGDVQKLKIDLQKNGVAFIASLVAGAAPSAAKQANYTAIKAKLVALGIDWQGSNIADAAVVIGKHPTPQVTIQTEKPPPPFDAARALAEIQAEHGHHATIAGVEVYLDKDQAAHQPTNQPIGSRQTSGKRKFKNTIASRAWHETNTMSEMAEWANGLTADLLVNGTKEFFGQAKDHFGISYEAYCQEINGTRYVSYHCYPARSVAGDALVG